ncbi:hypothetical protein FBHYGVHD_CDS0108 [Staphylococcus phage MVC_VPHSA1]|uniref:Uncharacterized protein n=1 Tax=Staphylococcus phage MVC_VPHSA1 TaxID=3088876 RepID=A0ABZ0QYT5_9CAUD|nr:hypothetical protein FBHYGVHD_CDS0108 [Staphylococcus phage MVC_VPHSA1]
MTIEVETQSYQWLRETQKVGLISSPFPRCGQPLASTIQNFKRRKSV